MVEIVCLQHHHHHHCPHQWTIHSHLGGTPSHGHSLCLSLVVRVTVLVVVNR